ncbi:MAG: hypothetical protein WAO98_04410, partial [Alphaproteobacteria bacterium]
ECVANVDLLAFNGKLHRDLACFSSFVSESGVGATVTLITQFYGWTCLNYSPRQFLKHRNKC